MKLNETGRGGFKASKDPHLISTKNEEICKQNVSKNDNNYYYEQVH